MVLCIVLDPAANTQTPSRGTLKTSLCATRAFPTPDYPGRGYTVRRLG